MEKISPSRLRTIRTRLGLTITELEKMSKVSAKTISNAEKSTDETVPANERTINRLSRALGQRPEVLSGQVDMPQEISRNKTLDIELDSLTRLNYDLLERRYGVSKGLIFSIAPFLFALAAEESLTRQLREAVKYAEKDDPDSDFWDDLMYDDVEKIEYIEEKFAAVENNDILEKSMEKFYKYGFQGPNPFADYLHEKRFDNRIVSILFDDKDFFYSEMNNGMPEYIVCNAELERICLGSNIAREALQYGFVSIEDIPDYLWEPTNSGARIEWLELKYNEKIKELENKRAIQDSENNATE